MSDEADVLDANERFYDAFRRRDVAALDALWSEATPMACIHPGWEALHGRAAVLKSFRAIVNAGAPDVRCEGARAYLLGDAAFVICHEAVDGAALIATNMFVREGGAWRMVHHQAGPIAPRQRAPRPRAVDPSDLN